jgi:DNA-binding beta-propeller fold protein YncE
MYRRANADKPVDAAVSARQDRRGRSSRSIAPEACNQLEIAVTKRGRSADLSSTLASTRRVVLGLVALLAASCDTPRAAGPPTGFLASIHRHVTLTSTVTENGDLNPSAVIVAPVTAGKLAQGDVLVTNSSNIANLLGTGTTIMSYRPSTRQPDLFARLPRNLPECPGGVGLSGSLAMLKSGWVIVGSAPSTDGTTATKGAGCLLVLDAEGRLASVWAGPMIDCPWGNIVVIERAGTASLFVAMAGFGVPAPDRRNPDTGYPVTIRQGKVLRLDLAIADGRPPELVGQTVIGDGFAERADFDNFLIGPTGLALGANGALYVTDGKDNRVSVIADAATRADSAGRGTLLTRDGLLAWPLSMATTPDGHLLVCNGRDGLVVEIDPATRKQISAQWINTDQAQVPPGNGNLFGIAMTQDGAGFYYVENGGNTLLEAR